MVTFWAAVWCTKKSNVCNVWLSWPWGIKPHRDLCIEHPDRDGFQGFEAPGHPRSILIADLVNSMHWLVLQHFKEPLDGCHIFPVGVPRLPPVNQPLALPQHAWTREIFIASIISCTAQYLQGLGCHYHYQCSLATTHCHAPCVNWQRKVTPSTEVMPTR